MIESKAKKNSESTAPVANETASYSPGIEEEKIFGRQRVWLLDEIRGFCILCMVVYHIMYDLNYLYNIKVPIFFDNWFGFVRDSFAGIFIFISGSVTVYSKSNLRRGVKCFFLGMVITFVTAFVLPWSPVYFGILHMLGTSMMLFGLFEHILERIKPVLGLSVFMVLFFLTYNIRNGYLGIDKLLFLDLPPAIYDAELLFPLGFIGRGFTSGDYFPLMPWLFLFIAGSFFGKILKSEKMPQLFYKSYCKPLGIIGRYTIWIYLLHQPIAFLILSLILYR